MIKRTRDTLCTILAIVIVRCKAVALDWTAGEYYLDCSWDTLDIGKWYDRPNGSYWGNRWKCSNAKLAQWVNMTGGRPTIACIGDSNTRGLGLRNKWKNAFPARLHRHRRLNWRYNTVNLGVAGTTAQRSNRGTANYWGMPQWNDILPALRNVAMVIVQLGTNDATVGVWNRTVFRNDYIRMLQNITKMHPHATIITSVPPPVSMVAAKKYAYVNNELVTEIGMATRMASLSVPRKNVNMQHVFAGQDAAASEDDAAMGEQAQRLLPRMLRKMLPRRMPGWLLQDDGVHVSQAGHDVMASTFAALVVELKSAT
mmetsp:Transcript_76869/g.204086  ORF Transcript_76869/g.204086 Transcript_76869/m.204086 type:complete len:313 (+) Transcript_76869:47-985(+)